MKLLSLAVALLRRGGAASSPFVVRTVHSKSVIPRGRAGIRVSQGRRKRRATSKILKSLASKHKWPYHGDSNAQPIDTEEQQLRKAAADWPSWLPKPKDYIAAEQRQKIEEEQEQTRKAAQSHSQPPTVEAVFIPKSSPEHSSRRKQPGDGSWSNAFSPWGKRRGFSTLQARSSAASASGPVTRQLPDWPSWLPPRSTEAPFDRDFHLFFRFLRRHRVAIFGFAVAFGGTYYCLDYRRNPLTGRRQVLDVSDAIIEENARDAFRSVAFRYADKVLDDDHSYVQRARDIAERIIAAAMRLDSLDLKGTVTRATGRTTAAAEVPPQAMFATSSTTRN